MISIFSVGLMWPKNNIIIITTTLHIAFATSRHCSKILTCINSFNLHNNHVMLGYYYSHLKMKKLGEWEKNFSKVSWLARGQSQALNPVLFKVHSWSPVPDDVLSVEVLRQRQETACRELLCIFYWCLLHARNCARCWEWSEQCLS